MCLGVQAPLQCSSSDKAPDFPLVSPARVQRASCLPPSLPPASLLLSLPSPPPFQDRESGVLFLEVIQGFLSIWKVDELLFTAMSLLRVYFAGEMVKTMKVFILVPRKFPGGLGGETGGGMQVW